jgi:hypothetical protein
MLAPERTGEASPPSPSCAFKKKERTTIAVTTPVI